MDQAARRMSYLFLCALPFVLLIVGGVRALRIPGVYPSIGVVLFAAILLAAWILGARTISSHWAEGRTIALAGTLFVVPWAVISLLWVTLPARVPASLILAFD